MESWKKVWREGVAPSLSIKHLLALKAGLEKDDPNLIQEATTSPPPLVCVRDWPVEAACLLGYCGWRGEGRQTVESVEEFFARICFEADERLGEPAAVRWLLNYWDDTPREEARRNILTEVLRTLAQRGVGEPSIAV